MQRDLLSALPAAIAALCARGPAHGRRAVRHQGRRKIRIAIDIGVPLFPI